MSASSLEAPGVLQEALDAVLDFVGATAGWVAVTVPNAGLSFPARRGDIPEVWLQLHHGEASVWGISVRNEPTLLNDMPAWTLLREPPLHNLLSCALPGMERPLGHIVVVNKPNGFTSHDATVLQTMAHFLGKQLSRRPAPPSSSLWRLGLDRASEGILLFDRSGTLIFANATWLQWTGYAAEELCHQPAPYPFWISHRDLGLLGGAMPILPRLDPQSKSGRQVGYLPFRHRNHSLFWCRVEMTREPAAGEGATVAFLRRLPQGLPLRSPGLKVPEPEMPASPLPEREGDAVSFLVMAENLPFALALTDRYGQVLWINQAFARGVVPAAVILGQPLRQQFSSLSTASLERLFHSQEMNTETGRGQLLLQRRTATGFLQSWVAFWHAVALPQEQGFLFALAEDWDALWTSAGAAAPALATSPEADILVLLVRPGGRVDYWDDRWERLTGLPAREVASVAAAVVLDWLFPQENERNFVADVLHQSERRTAQAVLEVAGSSGRHPLLCTFLPVSSEGAAVWTAAGPLSPGRRDAPAGDDKAWLLLAGQPPSAVGESSAVQRYLRQFTRGLSHLLNNYLTVPVGLSELALDRTDLPPDLKASFAQILDSCMRAGQLLAALQDLTAVTTGTLQLVELASLVREALDESAARDGPFDGEVAVEADPAGALVAVNPRMLKTVLQQLLSNARHALLDSQSRRIHIRIQGSEHEISCAIQDNGEGLSTADWTGVFAPFYSTKGPFAREAGHATLEALGLGLKVSQHLLALHGGRLELRSAPGEGTTAVFTLPRGQSLPATPAPVAGREALRTDSAIAAGPRHARQEKEEKGNAPG